MDRDVEPPSSDAQGADLGGDPACWVDQVRDCCGTLESEPHRPGCDDDGSGSSSGGGTRPARAHLVIHTRLCDLLGAEYPILNAPMGGGDAPGRLAGAVSEAGALGMIGGTTLGGETWLLDEIRVARDQTDRRFGVGFICHLPNALELMHVALRDAFL